MTPEDLKNVFSYHEPKGDQVERYNLIRDAVYEAALVIVENTPACADQTASIRKLREAAMTANAAIACNE
jgi:hypothetical protein